MAASDAAAGPQRKIIHVDMDAFYASVEQRDDPALRNRPVVVAWRGARSVVCAASYEARRYGIRSAMPATRAERLCPDAVFVPPDFVRYRQVSRQVRAIMLQHTALVEPLSLDEAYLDVTERKPGFDTATSVAEDIRRQIRDSLQLTASAGVAANKFLAKIASDWRKPDGLFVIRPQQVLEFLAPLPVSRLPGVGKVTEERLQQMGIVSVAQLREHPPPQLEQAFGRYGRRLSELAYGIDERPVQPDQPVQSVSSEDTFADDLPLADLAPHITRLAENTWKAAAKTPRIARTVVLKLKTADFRVLTRSHTPERPPDSAAELAAIALALTARVVDQGQGRYRLVGVGLGNFQSPEDTQRQPELF